jgi:Zn-dependent membrane protease YugP
MFFGDPLYMVVMLVGAALVFLPQLWVKSTVAKHSEEAASYTGREVAERILANEGLHNVRVEATPGELSDHYDPTARAVRLSEANYYGRSVAGIAIAAHEVGHALQHAHGYYPVVLRSALVPAVNIGSQLGPMLFFISLGMGATSQVMPDWAWTMAWVGVALFGSAVLFHMVTLPVEINASARALKILNTGGFVTASQLPGARQVLTAAAFTYVAAALYALIQLLYFVFRLMNARREE